MYLLAFIIFCFGAIIGSFLNVLILRLPREETIGGRSHCEKCGHELAVWDLVPIFSFIFLGAKCRYCKQPISPRYFWVEMVTGVLFALSFLSLVGMPLGKPLLLISWFIVSTLVVIFMIDWEHFLILDKVVLPATLVLLAMSIALDWFSHDSLLHSRTLTGLLSGLGVFVFFGAVYYFSRGRGIGMGDVKLSFFIGLATPAPLIAINLFLCFAIGAIVGVFLILFKDKHLHTKVPLGVFLSLSTLLTLFYGNQLWTYYLNLIGWR